MLHTKLLLASIVAATCANAALANGILPAPQPVSVVVAPPVYDWTGFYVGGFLGFASGDYTGFDANGRGPVVDVDGGIYGLALGYDFQNGNIVYGGVLDISNGPEGTQPVGTAGPAADSWNCFSGECNTTINTLVTLRGRVGYAVNNSLFFASAGAAWGDVDGGIFNSAQQGSGNATGWAASIGYEHAFSNSSSVSIEFMHVDLGDIPFGIGIAPNSFEGDGDFSTLRVGYNYRF